MYKHVLIPLDGSPLAEQALPHAIAQARHSQAELILLRVVEPFAHVRGMSLADLEQIRQQATAWAREYLERIAAGVREHGISVQMVITEGRSHTEITRCVEANQVDLIVLSTRGRSGFSRWLMGSVADRIVRGATVPVLLVRARKEEA
jgi:nucleotide-binding universal stress UspA family protein